MKVSVLLPILTAGASKKKDRNDERQVMEGPCSSQVPRLGGDFKSINEGLSGAIILDHYPELFKCNHTVKADSSCEEIKISYRSVQVEQEDDCDYDSFRFGWTGAKGSILTKEKCSCYADGCDPKRGFPWSDKNMLGPESFLVDSNTFTFYFKSDQSSASGHVILDWECSRQRTTTSTTTTTTRKTTTTVNTM